MSDSDHIPSPDAGRLLVVNDNRHIQQLLRVAFSGTGFDVVAVASGEQALRVLGHGGFDLMILDVRMPTMSGLEVLRHVRASARTQTLPVILLTGEGDLQNRVEGLNLGASDYVVKPFELAGLSWLADLAL